MEDWLSSGMITATEEPVNEADRASTGKTWQTVSRKKSNDALQNTNDRIG